MAFPSSLAPSASSSLGLVSSPTSSHPSIVTPPPQVTTQSSNNNGNGTIATSASLYLYTFLATLVLLLSVSAAIVIRSFILRRRHRLMVEEAIRNGTWVPPVPPTRPPRVDLSKKPVLWEAYIDGKGDLIGHATGGEAYEEKKINDVWRMENSKEWDMIKPFAVAYLAPNASATTTTAPATPITPAMTGLAAVPSIASLRSIAAPEPPATPTAGPHTDVEAANGAVNAATPRRRALLSRALNMLNPTPDPTSPLPAPLSRSNGGSNSNLPATNGNGEMEQNGPQVMRVAVLIAMPSPPSGAAPGHGGGMLSASGISSSSVSSASSSKSPLRLVSPIAAQSQSVASPPHRPPTHPLLSLTPDHDDDEHPLPHLEVGVADVRVVSSDDASRDDTAGLAGKKKAAQRGSMGSVATGMSEGSDM